MAFIGPKPKEGESNETNVSSTVEDTSQEDVQHEQELETKTAELLQKTFEPDKATEKPAESDSESDSSTPVKDDPAKDDDDEDGPTPAEKEQEAKLELEREENQVKDDEQAKDEDAEKSDKQEDIPQLSDAYFRAAIHRGFSEEQIKDFYESNPKLATQTFANIYEAVNRSNREYADFGRQHKKMAQEAAEAPAPGVKPTATEATENEYKGLDIEALRRDNPDDPLVDMIVAMENQNKIQHDEVQALKSTRSAPSGQPSGLSYGQQRAIEQETAAIGQQIESFFGADEQKGYADFYGTVPKGATNWDALTPGEKANRFAVVEMMDEMIAGAGVFGREMKIDEAMNLAHLSVSEPLREKIIRDGIKTKLEKRSNSISLKPSGTAKPTSVKPASQQELETVTQARLDKVFNA